jgi:hypothetical protein
VKGTEHWSDDALWGLESIARAGGEGPEGKAVAEKFVKVVKGKVSDKYAEKIAKNVKELQDRGITGADGLVGEIADASKNENWGRLKGAVFEAEVAADSRYVDDVAEVRRDIPNGEIDILLENGDIIECKNINWDTLSPDIRDKRIQRILRQTSTYRNYNSNANIQIIFKELPITVRSDIESKLIATYGTDVMGYVILEVF